VSNAKYRAAVIGCGKMSRGHAHAFMAAADVELVAGADVFERAREAFAAEFGAPAMYDDPAEMLAAEQPDIVSICTWPPLHAELTNLAIKQGVKAIWCEKPMAVHPAEARAMVDAADAAGVVLVINHQRRFGRAYNEARSLIAAGEIGKITQITGICGGDALTDGTHLIDMTRYLNNDVPVTRVFGAIEMSPMGDINPDGMGTIEFNQTRKRYGHHVESGALAILYFENGVRGHLEMGNLARGGYQRFLIDGTRGRIEISGDQLFADGSQVRVRRQDGEMEYRPPIEDDTPMDDVLAGIIATIETGAPHRLIGESGRIDLEIVNAIYESARQRRTISLPLDVTESPLEAMLVSGEIPLN